MRLVQEVLKGANIEVECIDSYPAEVTIEVNGEVVFQCPQRDLFRKYNWPAKPRIIAALRALKSA